MNRILTSTNVAFKIHLRKANDILKRQFCACRCKLTWRSNKFKYKTRGRKQNSKENKLKNKIVFFLLIRIIDSNTIYFVLLFPFFALSLYVDFSFFYEYYHNDITKIVSIEFHPAVKSH